ncbi:hypothetical protein [Spirosoma jeollabukense]
MRPLHLTLLFLISLTASAQVRVSNVRVSLNAEGMLVTQYDVQGIASEDSVYVAINGLKSGRLTPISLTGDLGRKVAAGTDKTIYWDIVKDAYKINEDVVVTVLIKLARGRLPQSAPMAGASGRARAGNPVAIAQTDPEPAAVAPVQSTPVSKPTSGTIAGSAKTVETKNLDVDPAPKKEPSARVAAARQATSSNTSVVKKGGGPANALLSALAPGIGNIFVQPDHKIGVRPAVTVVYAGLLIYGLTQRSQSQKDYNEYKALPRFTEQGIADAAYTKANNANHTAILCTAGAVAIWAIDVTATLLRGLQNQRSGSVSTRWTPPRTQVSIAAVGTTPVVAIRHKF